MIPVAAPGAWLGLTDEVSGPVGLAGQLWQSGPLVCMHRLFWDDLQGESKKALRLIKHSLFFGKSAFDESKYTFFTFLNNSMNANKLVEAIVKLS